jgi:hypothetical protein
MPSQNTGWLSLQQWKVPAAAQWGVRPTAQARQESPQSVIVEQSVVSSQHDGPRSSGSQNVGRSASQQ